MEDKMVPIGHQARVDIRGAEPLPNICIKCGVPTQNKVWVKRDTEIGGESTFIKIFMAIFSFRSFIMNNGYQGQKYSALAHIPICKACKTRYKKVTPANIDFKGGTISFLVHKRFYEELEKLRVKQ